MAISDPWPPNKGVARISADGPHLISGSCSSPRSFGLVFLQTPPRGDAIALLLAFGSANTWQRTFTFQFCAMPGTHVMAFTGGEAVWCNARGWPTFPPTAIRKSAWFFPP